MHESLICVKCIITDRKRLRFQEDRKSFAMMCSSENNSQILADSQLRNWFALSLAGGIESVQSEAGIRDVGCGLTVSERTASICTR